MRTRILYSHIDGHKVAEYHDGECVFMDEDYFYPRNESAMVMDDLPAYQSPIDGSIIEGRRARREDLKRNGCRPFEGTAAELKEAQRQQAYIQAREEQALDRAAHEVFYQHLSPSKQDILRKYRG